MKVSLNWLNEYVKVNDIEVTNLVSLLTSVGLEVESYDVIDEIEGLVVGEVIECVRHPDSDHMHITKTKIKDDILQIVCGAPNVRQGLKVIVATSGTKLGSHTIKPTKLRGIDSNGMLCSLLELGIDKEKLEDDSCSMFGIEELDDSFNVGDTNILEKLGYKDIILDINILPNRIDLSCMFYLAKEVGAILKRPVKLPSFESDIESIKGNFNLKSNTEKCPYIQTRIINKLEIKPSPKWLKKHLQSVGIKSINNVVDISNYVMLETGQPLHFYDLRSNPNRELVVKDNVNELYKVLDDNEYQLQEGDIVITSSNKTIGIAGIMGGNDSKIQDDTTAILIESALFDGASIRKTSNRLGLQSQAALRFSKGLCVNAQEIAMNRACELLKLYANAQDFEEIQKYGEVCYQERVIQEDLKHLNKLIGKQFEITEVKDILTRLNFKIELSEDSFKVHVPFYRYHDIKLACDVDEEIVRMSDFNDLQANLGNITKAGKLNKVQKITRTIEETLNNLGITNVMTYTLVEDKYVNNQLLMNDEVVCLAHPLSDNRKYIRNSLINSLVETLSYNLDHFNNNVNLYEISTVYGQNTNQNRLGIILNGKLQENRLVNSVTSVNFYTIKGILKSLLTKIGINEKRYNIIKNDIELEKFNPYQSACITLNNQVIGIFGQLHPNYLNNKKLKDVYYLELILDDIFKLDISRIKANEINKFPSVTRDISLIVSDDVLSSTLLSKVKKAGGKLVSECKIIDIYKGENIEEGKSSITINIVLESFDHTLSNDEITSVYDNIIKAFN